MKVKKKFTYRGTELRVVEVEEKHMNSSHTIGVTKVLAPNGGEIPVVIGRKQTLKSIIAETTKILDDLNEIGVDVISKLNEEL